ncbi:DNA-binding LytR/AlgR family response regulator [Catalinimonas alkaloidigena]|uniref:LytR/AlgR family response regulator transcription factor n=1 Tax=Catalinimonas alkaloidigena TaxID=1075417 RepID=UPI002404A029|nr:LytTR family DNA-binding domain-containing protein [Catalinimonas alkaloidigena]MDF9794826.1 DNA-binding LytR/AlgR family response regulator [Catalinimonas alkaloidigena]
MDGKIDCVVVDDDQMMLKIIESLIKKTDQLNLVGSYDHAVNAINILEQQPIDLIFLDIEMPEMNGLEFIKALSYHPQIILISNKKQYALDAFEYDVADYLLKPIASYARFMQAIGRAKMNLQQRAAKNTKTQKHIYLKVDSLLVKFDLEDIHWIEAFGDYVRVKTTDNLSTVYATLKSVEDALPPLDFVRIHRSYIVRVDKIENIDIGNLQIKDKILPISQSHKKKLMGMINSL